MDINNLYGSVENEDEDEEFRCLRDYIKTVCGICIPPEKSYLIETRLSKLMVDVGTEDFTEFYNILVSKPDPLLRQKIIDAITTNESLWFRDVTPWKLLEEVVIPKLVDEIASGRKIRARIWSSAVSTGQEIYSAVMCIDRYLKRHPEKGVKLSDFEFIGTDISNRVLDIAKKGRYDRISMTRGMREDYKLEYFTENGFAWDISPRIRDAVSFRHLNLMDSYGSLGVFDIIFCRYVLIYFANELKREIISKMNGALKDNGIMLIGNYVLYDMISQNYDVNHYENITYYSKKAVIK